MRIFLLFLFFLLGQYGSAQDVFDEFDSFFSTHTNNGLVDYKSVKENNSELAVLKEKITTFEFRNKTVPEQKAFLINAYNFFVIAKLAERFPVTSPKSIPNFFLKRDIQLSGKKYSLDQIEKDLLFGIERDPRLHLALICGAKSCPPFPEKTLRPEGLNDQLEAISKRAINDMNFIMEMEDNICVSQIFNWYSFDFGDLHSFLKKYRPSIAMSKPFKFLDYDWGINDISNQGSGASRIAFMTPSQLLGTGTWEFKAFQNAYVQKNKDGFDDFNTRSIYFSSFNQFTYGLNPNVNLGLDIVWKWNDINNPLFENVTDSIYHADGTSISISRAHGLAHIAPRIKFKPFKNISKLTIQESLFIPVNKSVDGQLISFTQFFYDQNLSPKTSVFLELSFWTPLSPDLKVFPFARSFWSYFPNRHFNLYAMVSLPGEYGAGAKLNITRRVELELLYTRYVNIERFFGDRSAQTFNIGLRIHP